MPDNEVNGNATDEVISIDSARDTLGALVLRAAMKNERITITRHGLPAAALVSIADLDRLRTLDAEAAAA